MDRSSQRESPAVYLLNDRMGVSLFQRISSHQHLPCPGLFTSAYLGQRHAYAMRSYKFYPTVLEMGSVICGRIEIYHQKVVLRSPAQSMPLVV